MRFVQLLFVCLGFSTAASASEPVAATLLKSELGSALQIVSAREIRYCPDNTCDIFRIGPGKPTDQLPSFAFLYLFHQSDYAYLNQSSDGRAPFRESAKDSEILIRKRVERFCRAITKSPECILAGMKRELGISVKLGRFDEGKFVEE